MASITLVRMSSREAQKRRAREAREAAERQAAARGDRRRLVALVLGMLAALAAVGVPALLILGGGGSGGGGGSDRPTASIPAKRVSDLGEAVKLAGAKRISYDYDFGINDHTDGAVRYPTNPPTNGPHAFTWAQDGDYAGQAAPPTGQVVHAQEHGRVVIQYRPGISEHKLAQLVALYEESPEHVLLLENATDMPCEVAATAWGQGVLCPKLNARSFDALRAFRDRFRGKGPESVP